MLLKVATPIIMVATPIIMVATPTAYIWPAAVITPLMSIPSSVRVPVLSKHTSLILPQRLTLSQVEVHGGMEQEVRKWMQWKGNVTGMQ